MLNKIAFPWQSLASCDGFISFRENLLATEGLLPEEKAVRMPFLLALKFSLAWYDFYHYLFNLYHFQDPQCEILSQLYHCKYYPFTAVNFRGSIEIF